MPRPERARYSVKDILSVLLYAAAQKTTIEQASVALKEAPSSNTVRGAAGSLEVEALEENLNQALALSLPKRLLISSVEIAIDLKLVPYYGEAKEEEEDFLICGPAREGTNTFFCYASIYLIKKRKRFTLALTVVRRKEGLIPVLDRLLDRFSLLGGKIRCLYLDRQFYTVEVLDFLIHKRDIPFVMAAPKKGKKGGIKGLIRKAGVGVHPYTVCSPKNGKIAVSVAVVGKYLKGRWKKHKRERYAFVIHKYPFSLEGLFQKYRHRFGIESSYRIWEEARARTASQKASLRLLMVGIALLLQNLWVFLLWNAVSIPSQGGRKILRKLFPFHRLLLFLQSAIEHLYLPVEEVIIYD
ncbi:MAG: transposase [Candidatus Freyarchaeota archaeon]